MHKAAMSCKRMEGKEWFMCVVSRFRKPPEGEGNREKREAARVVRAPPFHIYRLISLDSEIDYIMASHLAVAVANVLLSFEKICESSLRKTAYS